MVVISMNFLKFLFGNYSKRELRRIQPIVDAVLSREKQYMNMADEELKAQTHVLKQRLKQGETLDDILPDAFAACKKTLSSTNNRWNCSTSGASC